ncbi:MAG: nuclear transport factor 2 family protein [Candidatus Levyibacteriota bacterium]
MGHCSGTNAKGEEENIEFRLTVGLRRENGKWLIEHEHHSLPSE